MQGFGVANDDQQIGKYAGIVASAFALCQFLTGVWWGRLADKIGRKRCITYGLCGTLVSGLMFGFSVNFPMAVVARSLGGLLNGNVGVIRTMVSELTADPRHESITYSIMPVVWSVGSILGPLLGGALADPATSYPGSAFARSEFFTHWRFALPGLVISTIVATSIVLSFLFVEEVCPCARPRACSRVRPIRNSKCSGTWASSWET